MTQKTRIKREPPRRGGPIRDVTRAFRSPAAAPTPAQGRERPPDPPSWSSDEGREGARAGGPGPRVIEQAVETAYRVFDGYMQRGREAAHRHHRPEEPGGSVRYQGQDPSAMPMRYWMDLAQMWFGFMMPLAPWGMRGRSWDMGGGPRDPDGRPPHPTREGREWGERPQGPPDAKLALAVDVAAVQPVGVVVKLHDKDETRQLEARQLGPIHGDAPPLTGIHFSQVDGHLRVQVTVPSDQPVGAYAGMITERETGSARGTLEVVIHPRHA
jgi:hypothetical protein